MSKIIEFWDLFHALAFLRFDSAQKFAFLPVLYATARRSLSPLHPFCSLYPMFALQDREMLMQAVSNKFKGELDVLVNNVGTNIRKVSRSYTYEAHYASD